MRSNLLSSSSLLVALCLFTLNVNGHGSVVAEDDLCIIKVGYFQAHFKIYLPEEKRHSEFCEDLPVNGNAIFVMEYIHGALGSAPMEFRIIRNVTGKGNFTRIDDVENIESLNDVTVFHQPFAVHPDVFTAMHNFDTNGEYLGIITAKDSNTTTVYTAVFPFEVGYTRFGYLPLFILLLVISQGLYWAISRKRHKQELFHESRSQV